MSVVGRLDRFQRRHPSAGLPLAVVYKFLDDQGFYLSALVAFYAFISLFPLFLLFSTILGFALENDPGLRQEILDSAARQIPVIGQQIETQQLRGSGTAVTVAVLTAVFGSLGVAQALQNAMNVAWGVRRNERPNPVLSRVRSLGLLGVLGLFIVATTVLSQLGSVIGDRVAWFSNTSAVFLFVGSLALSSMFFVVVCRMGTSAAPRISELLPGALLGGLLWQGLQTGGNAFVTTVVARSSATNGVFAVVLGLLAWLYLAGIALVFCVEANVVLARRLYPRSLMTPMTDRVDLTEADQAAYARLVRAQSLKGFQNVEVTFDYDGQYASEQRRRRKIDAAQAEESAATRTLRLREGLRRAAVPVASLIDLASKPVTATVGRRREDTTPDRGPGDSDTTAGASPDVIEQDAARADDVRTDIDTSAHSDSDSDAVVADGAGAGAGASIQDPARVRQPR